MTEHHKRKQSKTALTRVPPAFPRYQAMCVDFERLDMPLESFHVVSMCDVLEHMPFPRVALAKASRRSEGRRECLLC